MLKKYLSILFTFFITNFVFHLEAAQLHVILVGDTLVDTEFGGSIDFMKREVKRIAAYTGLDLNGYVFEGLQVRVKNVLQTLSDLNIGSEDVVILYFALHGSRSSQKNNQWPDLIFTLDVGLAGKEGYFDFDAFNAIIKAKKPRLLLSIADSCNSERSTEEIVEHNIEFPIVLPERFTLTPEQASFLFERVDEELIEYYQQLFLKPQGTIITSSSSPGEFATKLPVMGGIYTLQFLTSLYEMTLFSFMRETVNWKSILELASDKTKKILQLDDHSPATPQSMIELK